ncbi:MAG TPA: signal peptidase I [Clostridia bacterium]
MESLLQKRRKKIITFGDIVIMVMIIYLAALNLYHGYTIIGSSMEPTFHESQIILVNRFPLEPQPGDVVILLKDGNTDMYIKRVIAVEGNTFKFVKENDQVNLYFKKGNEWKKNNYGFSMTTRSFGGFIEFGKEYTVPKDCFFVMGDNRNNSTDSRTFGFVAKHELRGKVIMDISDNEFLKWIFYRQ